MQTYVGIPCRSLSPATVNLPAEQTCVQAEGSFEVFLKEQVMEAHE